MDGLDGIEPQAVKMVLAKPVTRIFHHVTADAFTSVLVVIDGLAPGSLVLIGKVRAKKAQIIAFVAQMVVDHIENYRQANPVGSIDQSLKSQGAAVTGLHCVGRDAVISPTA